MVSFLSSARANFVLHFSSGIRTIRIHKAIPPVSRCALDYHKFTDKKCSGQWEQAFLDEIKGLIESTIPGEMDDWAWYWVDMNYHKPESEGSKRKIILFFFFLISKSVFL